MTSNAFIEQKERVPDFQYELFEGYISEPKNNVSEKLTILRGRSASKTVQGILFSAQELEQCFSNGSLPSEISDSEVLFFVPRSKHRLLNLHLPSLLCRGGCNFEISRRLADYGIVRVGELVRISETEFLEATGSWITELRDVRGQLHEIGLRFNMKTPGWQSPRERYGDDW